MADLDKELESWMAVSGEIRRFVETLQMVLPHVRVKSIRIGSNEKKYGTILGIPFVTDISLRWGDRRGITYEIEEKRS